jgi:hypothetical protein
MLTIAAPPDEYVELIATDQRLFAVAKQEFFNRSPEEIECKPIASHLAASRLPLSHLLG